MKHYYCDREFALEARRWLHQHPELSGQEHATADFIRKHLAQWGIEYVQVGATGTFAKIKGLGDSALPQRSVLLRADIDALPIEEHTTLPFKSAVPKAMHACGHDIHTACLLAAAKELQEHRQDFGGTVLLAFQQAEEFGHGSQFFVEQGLNKGYDRALALHIAPDYPVGTAAISKDIDAASCDYFRIEIKGKSAHSSKPQLGSNALLAGAVLVNELTKLKSEYMDPMENAIVSIGKFEAGKAFNIVADSATLEGSFRTFSEPLRDVIRKKILDILSAVDTIHGVKSTYYFEGFASVLRNDSEAAAEVTKVFENMPGDCKVVHSAKPVFAFAADDFAEFLKETKGVYVHLGVANDNPHSSVGLHQSDFEPDEKAISLGAELFINYAMGFFQGSI